MATNATLSREHPESYLCNPAPLWMRFVALIASIVVIGVGGIGNLTTLLAFARSRVLWKFQNINIFCMTVNDFVVCTYVCGHFVEKYWIGCWTYSVTYCHVYSTINGITFFSGLILLALVAYDRFLMVELGALYNNKESVSKVLTRTIPLAYVMPIGVIICMSWFHWFTGVMVNVNGICIPEVVQSLLFYELITWIGVIGPAISMFVCYVVVHRKRLGATVAPITRTIRTAARTRVPEEVAQLHKKKRATRTLDLLCVMVLITSTPFVLLSIMASLISSAAAPTWVDATFWLQLFDMSFPIAWLNNAINPWLYAHTMPEYKRTMRDVWRPLLDLIIPTWYVKQSIELGVITAYKSAGTEAATRNSEQQSSKESPAVGDKNNYSETCPPRPPSVRIVCGTVSQPELAVNVAPV